MTGHRYRVGQRVKFHQGRYFLETEWGYEVIRQLPMESDECEYRITSLGGLDERVAKESELEKA
jgi:hypothetical protein